MSECVVRMEMPSNCERCPMCGTASGGNGMYKLWCMCGDIPASSQRRPDDCPIICQLPEGHGRLVDADALVNQWATVPDKLAAGAGENKWVADMVMGIQGHFLEGIIKSLEEAPTIVPAERSET